MSTRVTRLDSLIERTEQSELLVLIFLAQTLVAKWIKLVSSFLLLPSASRSYPLDG